MPAVLEARLTTFETDLTREAKAPDWHEIPRGEVFATTGARATHDTIALNIITALKDAPCRAPAASSSPTGKLQVL